MLTIEEMVYIIKNSDSKGIIVHPIILQKSKLSKEQVEGAIGINVMVLDDLAKKAESITDLNYNEVSDENLISTFIYFSTTGPPKAAMLCIRIFCKLHSVVHICPIMIKKFSLFCYVLLLLSLFVLSIHYTAVYIVILRNSSQKK
jgi:hypothetical protein